MARGLGHEGPRALDRTDPDAVGHVPGPGPVLREGGRLTARPSKLKAKDKRAFVGQVWLLDETSVSVISDIDDTIKITEVRDRSATLRNTFLREFQAVAGMAELYQTLARSNRATFHYVSASPWQLYRPLAEFVRDHGFPAGTFHLRDFRIRDGSFLAALLSPEHYKPGVIRPLLERFPQRRFVLVGDSGEKDPEIYGALARQFPDQIAGIWIRDVTGETPAAPRYQQAFTNVPPTRWRVFKEPTEITRPTP